MNAFEIVDILINQFFDICEQSKFNHIVCVDLNVDIGVGSERKQNSIQNLRASGYIP